MKRIFITILVLLGVMISYAQDDHVNKIPIYVLAPYVLTDAEGGFDTLMFHDMRQTVVKKVNKCKKVYAVEDRTKTKYWMLVNISDIRRESDTDKFGTEYMEYFKICVSIQDVSVHKVLATTKAVEKFGISNVSYEDAHKCSCMFHPAMAYIVQAVEEAFKQYGSITEVGLSADKKTVVYVDRGIEDGISDNQWFDVFLKNEDGTPGEQVGTLELVKLESNSCQCKPHKGKKEIVSFFSSGREMIVISRERSDIVKKTRHFIDNVRNIQREIEKSHGK